MTPQAPSTMEKQALFRRLFTGLPGVYGTYDLVSGRVRQVKAPVTDRVILDHLSGIQPYGVYLLFGERTRAVAVDFDQEDIDPPMAFVKAAEHYGISAYVERSKSKGYHVWIFFPECGVLARKARQVVHHILTEIQHPFTEVFPKQDSLDTSITYGNFINAPLFGGLVPSGRTVFLDANDLSKPAPDQWIFLRSIQTIPEMLLDQIIEVNDVDVQVPIPIQPHHNSARPQGRTYGLPTCARTMLAEGVTEYQRVSCFRLALHLKRAGLPIDLAIAALKNWAIKNIPRAGKSIITPSEIEAQVESAYCKDYRGCGCKEPAIARYCDTTCPLAQKTESRMRPQTKGVSA